MKKFFLFKNIGYGLMVLVIALAFVQTGFGQYAPIFDAVRNNDIISLRGQLEKGANPNAFDEDSDHVLINAAIYASPECMQLLLKHKANPNLKNKAGQTALMFCAQDTMRMKILLQYGADINASSYSKNTALLIACMGSNRFEQIKFLLRNGADAFATNAGKETALMRVSEFGDTLSLRLFLNMGMDVNINPWGFTPLMAATRMANWPAVNFLLDNGADANIPDPIGMTAVLWAAELNHTALVHKLLGRTNNINTIDSLAAMTPLMWATINEHDNPEIIKALIEKGADVNAKSKDGSTALSWALKKGNTKTVAELRKAGAH